MRQPFVRVVKQNKNHAGEPSSVRILRRGMAHDKNKLSQIMNTGASHPQGLQPEPSIAASDLLPQVYQELRRLAAHKLANEAPGQTLQATALVHEAWLRLIR